MITSRYQFVSSLLQARGYLAVLAVTTAVLMCPGAAGADTVTSQNWAGYAAHRTGVRFKQVTASWRQPIASCASGRPTYSAFWVGLGGYSLRSGALEQIGTELNCNPNGTQSISAWYELVPAPTRTIRITVSGGDLLAAKVAVSGQRVTLSLVDQTNHQSFATTLTDRNPDVTSAEWIAEAPSECTSASSCSTLPLADFRSVHFMNATAQTVSGKMAAIASALWTTTRIVLGYSPNGTRFVSEARRAHAIPTPLAAAGHTFSVNFSGQSGAGGARFASRAAIFHAHREAPSAPHS